MKKIKINGGRIAIIAILLVLVLLVGGMYVKLVELTSRIAYLQDTTNIILADMGGVESTITKTLQEESGMVEHYSIQLTDLDFSSDTYGVSVYMIPKEYTDKTKVSVFFGTIECPLEKDGYAYTGNITLPMEKSFDGNLTFLFADGRKRNTEVYSNYDGMRLYLDEVLSGGTEAKPKYEERERLLTLDGNLTYDLKGKDRYEFDRFELVAEYNGSEVWSEDLLKEEPSEDGAKPSSAGAVETEASGAVVMTPVSERAGETAVEFRYEPNEAGMLRVYLCAVTTEGYRFEYDLLRAELIEQREEEGDDSGEGEADSDGGDADGESEELLLKLDEESIDTTVSYTVYDNKGGKRVLQ